MNMIFLGLAGLVSANAGMQAAPNAATAIPAFDHVAISVADQQKSVDFYRGAFGLSEIPAPFPPGGPRWLVLADGISLHIQLAREKPVPPPRAVHFAVAVRDLAPVIAFLDRSGTNWTDSVGRARQIQATRTDKVRQIYFPDPDGYWVEVNDKLKFR